MEKIQKDLLANSIVFSENFVEDLNSYQKEYELRGIYTEVNQYYDDILVEISKFIDDKLLMQTLDDYMIDNICQIINYIRNNYKYKNLDEKRKKYDEINSIISILNKGPVDANTLWFYNDQVIKRGIYVDYGFKESYAFITDELIDVARKSLSVDNAFHIILSKDSISEDTFSSLVMNHLFIYSLNNFYVEGLDIVKDNDFIKRILLENKKIISSYKYLFMIDKEHDKSKSIRKFTKILIN